MWPHHAEAELQEGIEELLFLENTRAAFVAEGSDHRLSGFVDVSIRDVAEKCRTHPVGYLEGWYVEERHRRRVLTAL